MLVKMTKARTERQEKGSEIRYSEGLFFDLEEELAKRYLADGSAVEAVLDASGLIVDAKSLPPPPPPKASGRPKAEPPPPKPDPAPRKPRGEKKTTQKTVLGSSENGGD